MKFKSVYWDQGKLCLLDQTLLPKEIKYINCSNHNEVAEAIKQLKVRGAPAIGIAAAYALVLASENLKTSNIDTWEDAIDYLSTASEQINVRPTAVNLQFALHDLMGCIVKTSETVQFSLELLTNLLLNAANRIYESDKESCYKIGENGISLIKNGMQVLTYCNAGALATSELGTALAPLYLAHKKGINFNIYSCETRPLLQGSRLTSWELQQAGLNPILICDNMAASLMYQNRVDMVIVGADRIAKNGDTANKIGTYSLAILAKYHNIPFYVAAPKTTFDLNCQSGNKIEIELRDPSEIFSPEGVAVYNPAFDVTPNELITSIITDFGIINPVNEENIKKCLLN